MSCTESYSFCCSKFINVSRLYQNKQFVKVMANLIEFLIDDSKFVCVDDFVLIELLNQLMYLNVSAKCFSSNHSNFKWNKYCYV